MLLQGENTIGREKMFTKHYLITNVYHCYDHNQLDKLKGNQRLGLAPEFRVVSPGDKKDRMVVQ